jgi:TRAP-type mannitol/chloroaromatic compound transport system permease small subunit
VLFFCFMLVLLKEGWVLAEDAIGRMETSHSAWNPPVWPLKLTVPIGAALLMMQGVVKLVGDLCILFGCEQGPDHRADEEEGNL